MLALAMLRALNRQGRGPMLLLQLLLLLAKVEAKSGIQVAVYAAGGMCGPVLHAPHIE